MKKMCPPPLTSSLFLEVEGALPRMGRKPMAGVRSYAAKCTCCGGTGWMPPVGRAGRRRGRHGHASNFSTKCVACQGLGHVRVSTVRAADLEGDP